MTGNLSKHKKNIDNIYTKAEVDRRIKSATDEKVDELTKIIDKATENIESDIAQKADKTFVDAEISEVNVALERIKYYGSADVVPSDESLFTVNSTGETITGLTDTGKTQTELVIPYEINGVIITRIQNYAFYNCGSITSITIPNSIYSFGASSVFNGCKSLKTINIPNRISDIGESAFQECTSLTSINLPNSIKSICNDVFSGCTSLVSMKIPDSVTSISFNAFSNCTSLTEIEIPNSVTSIAPEIFEGCTSLTIYCEQGSYAETYAKENNIPVVYTDISSAELDNKADTAEVLTKTNTTAFAPTADYQPATKKYVDDAISAAISAYDTEAMALLGGDAE